MSISPAFLSDCFRELRLSANLRLLNICSEWRCLLLDMHPPDTGIICGNVLQVSDEKIRPPFCSGLLDDLALVCEQVYGLGSPGKDQADKLLVLASGLRGRIFLCCSVRSPLTTSTFCLIDAQDINRQAITNPTSSTYQDHHIVCRQGDDLVIRSSRTRICDVWMKFGDLVIPFRHPWVIKSLALAKQRLESLKDVAPGDKVELLDGTKMSVDMVFSSASECDKLAFWYVPTECRKPNTILVKDSEESGNRNIYLENIKTITKSARITAYCSDAMVLQVGYTVVLFTPGFPIGVVRATMEKYYSVSIEGSLYHLRYNEPLFKVFERVSNAEKWRSIRQKNLLDYLALVKPGDIVQRSFSCRYEIPAGEGWVFADDSCRLSGGKNSQGYYVLRKTSISRPRREVSVDMKAIDKFLVFNNIDEQLAEEELDEDFEQHILRKRYYIGNKEYIYQEDVQDVIIVPEADTASVKGLEKPVSLGDRLQCKISRRNIRDWVTVTRIVYGGLVLDDCYYPSDKVFVKKRVSPELASDEDEEEELPPLKKSRPPSGSAKQQTLTKAFPFLNVKRGKTKREDSPNDQGIYISNGSNFLTKYNYRNRCPSCLGQNTGARFIRERTAAERSQFSEIRKFDNTNFL